VLSVIESLLRLFQLKTLKVCNWFLLFRSFGTIKKYYSGKKE
jgi:hypothetical protein